MSGELFMWAKALHIIAVICWMAGLLYLPRLFVYHSQVAPGSEADAMLQTMERRLLRGIMNPAMIATFLLGFWLVAITHAFAPGNGLWMHLKFALVLALAGLHGMMARYRKDFARGQNRKTTKFYRIFNEVPAVLMVVIVILVVVKPV